MPRKLTLTEIARAIDSHLFFDGQAFRSSNFVILQYSTPERETALTTVEAEAYLAQLNTADSTIRHDGL